MRAEEERLLLEEKNVDRTRIGIFEPDAKVVMENKRRLEMMNQPVDEKTLDPRVGIFQRDREKSGSWFGWLNRTSKDDASEENTNSETSQSQESATVVIPAKNPEAENKVESHQEQVDGESSWFGWLSWKKQDREGTQETSPAGQGPAAA
jgi:hypothetical protein